MEENIEEELTFKKVWQYIKKSGVRIIIYALIALIVSGGILGICDIFVSESQYETSITYYYSGVELGYTPWGGQENVIAEIRSVNNVSSALDKLQYSDEEKDALVGLIIRNLNVVASIDNEVVDEDDNILSGNYSFRIVLSHDSTIDSHLKSRNDYNNILSEITANYIESFKSEYSLRTTLSNMTVLDGYNTLQTYDIIHGYINQFAEESKMWAQMAPNFISTSENMSFTTLGARIDIASLKLENYLNFVLSNGIDFNGESQFIDLKLKELEDCIPIYDQKIKELNEMLSIIVKNGEVNLPNSGVIVVNPPDSEKVTKEITDAINQKALAQKEFNSWEKRKEAFKPQDFEGKDDEKSALIARANALQLEAVNEYNAILASYKNMLDDYNSGYSVSSLVRMTASPKQTTTSSITLKIGVIVELMVLIIAVIIAMVVTNKKGAIVFKKKSDEDDVVVINEESVEPQGLPAQGLGMPAGDGEEQSDTSLEDEEK